MIWVLKDIENSLIRDLYIKNAYRVYFIKFNL
jgi:hypothetical protein